MNLSPIILTVYNRPEHTKKTIEALKANTLASQSVLYIYSDASPKEEDEENVKAVRKYIHSIKNGFKEIYVIERKKNFGLADNIINAVTEIINIYERIILVEDDLVSSPFFLEYMNNMLDKYENENKIFTVTGFGYPGTIMKIPFDYKYDIYFIRRAGSWGWGTWKNRWGKADWEVKDYEVFKKDRRMQKRFNRGGDDMSPMLMRQMEGKINSWAIRWCYTLFKNDAYCIYPVKSYIDNIGNDGSGVHCGKSDRFKILNMNKSSNVRYPPKVYVDDKLEQNFRSMFKVNKLKSIANKIKRILE